MKMTHELREALQRHPKWIPTTTRGGHVRLTHTSGAFAFAPSTPSDRRGIRNLEARMRRIEREVS